MEENMTIEVKTEAYPCHEGLALVCGILKKGYVAKLAGMSNARLSIALHGRAYRNQAIAYLDMESINRLNVAIQQAARLIMSSTIRPNDGHETMKMLSKVINMPTFWEQDLKYSKRQMQSRMNYKADIMYGKYPQWLCDKINPALQLVALRLFKVHLVQDSQQE